MARFLFGVRCDSRRFIGRALDETQASHSLTTATTLSHAEMAEGKLNAGRKRSLRKLEIKGECGRVPGERKWIIGAAERVAYTDWFFLLRQVY